VAWQSVMVSLAKVQGQAAQGAADAGTLLFDRRIGRPLGKALVHLVLQHGHLEVPPDCPVRGAAVRSSIAGVR
jgi:hypothetical protein